jgi:hypothetical protein
VADVHELTAVEQARSGRYREPMTASLETILVLAGLPAATMVLVALFTLGPNLRRPPRYRPGQQWPHPPVWWTVHPEALRDIGAGPQSPAATRAGRGGCRGDW